MVSIKMLKPYYIQADDEYVRVVLAYQYFAIILNKQAYQFVPFESEEIKINRRTQKVENVDARFAFQKGKDIIYMTMSDLLCIPEFLAQLHVIVQVYNEQKAEPGMADTAVIDELVRMNVKRMIDKALDNRNEEAFYRLVKML
ncbi:IDEAL domain-containing protein [Lentibacillus sp.]|uniref:IDEAL domain-containing protein n=1 Tax=Lentibacillus sp. TaxID=1925746 RepID=UPI002B4B8DAA|nr:IDEAL domain-containing protein [Lentibacillus sp.]HLS10303.1 IDEAL domain-containing protein [Lentibacillus sp.]